MKKTLLVLTLALCASMTFAQTVPTYVPTNGLVGYWPFNGNANDESGNGNNGVVFGTVHLTTDSRGNFEKAYEWPNSGPQFNSNNYIRIPNLDFQITTKITIALWVKLNPNFVIDSRIFGRSESGLIQHLNSSSIKTYLGVGLDNNSISNPIPQDEWVHIAYTSDSNTGQGRFYINGVLINDFNGIASGALVFNDGVYGQEEWNFGRKSISAFNGFAGSLDDIGIWNRALTQEEIANLYQGCALSITTQPTNQTTNISNNAQFTVVSSDPDATYQWQTDLGVGFQNISNAGQYSGATNNTLTIANTTLSNNNQLFRCVIAKASCTETSSVATLNVNEAIPSNVPTDGLVGYWPFNGDANDMSGNENNGTVNGATLTTDRNGNENSAYSFDGNSKINCGIPNQYSPSQYDNYSFSFWVEKESNNQSVILQYYTFNSTSNISNYDFFSSHSQCLNGSYAFQNYPFSNPGACSSTQINLSEWNHIVIIIKQAEHSFSIYKNGIYWFNGSIGSIIPYQGFLNIGNNSSNVFGFNGKIDDIAIYNRALTQEEITQLYYADNTCQSLFINTGVLSFNPPTYSNTVTIYPNPANDHITIDCGNLANVSGWSIKIFNTLGQEVFSGAMNTQQYVVPLKTWSGQGVYFVKIYDASNHLMNTKKIILQ